MPAVTEGSHHMLAQLTAVSKRRSALDSLALTDAGRRSTVFVRLPVAARSPRRIDCDYLSDESCRQAKDCAGPPHTGRVGLRAGCAIASAGVRPSAPVLRAKRASSTMPAPVTFSRRSTSVSVSGPAMPSSTRCAASSTASRASATVTRRRRRTDATTLMSLPGALPWHHPAMPIETEFFRWYITDELSGNRAEDKGQTYLLTQ